MQNKISFDSILQAVSQFTTLQLVLVAAGIVVVFIAAYYLIFRIVKQSITEQYRVPHLLYKFIFKPGMVVFGAVSLWLVMQWLEPLFIISVYKLLVHIILLVIIVSVGLLLTRALAFAREVSAIYYDTAKDDNLEARKTRTQFKIIEKVLNFVIVIATIAFVLMTFESVRHLGTTLLASAGVIGIIIGFAAQKSISTLVAGIQIAISQPIRIDDVVVLEGEWGRIEEITLTYVVVAIWDKRRLIVPINYFIEKPFQNWTRTTTELLATVFIYMDYTVPVHAIREELTRLLPLSKYWDGKLNVVQITNATDTNVEVRILISASNSDKAFDLRCEIREAIISFLQKSYPASLPKTRIEAIANKELINSYL